jgi:glucosamine-6-phosphate deaminase
MDLCFDRIDPKLRMPDAHLHFPTGDLAAYSAATTDVRCLVMQGGQGEVKHWAFNDPPKRRANTKRPAHPPPNIANSKPASSTSTP